MLTFTMILSLILSYNWQKSEMIGGDVSLSFNVAKILIISINNWTKNNLKNTFLSGYEINLSTSTFYTTEIKYPI